MREATSVYGLGKEEHEEVSQDPSPLPMIRALERLGHSVGDPRAPVCKCGWTYWTDDGTCRWCGAGIQEEFGHGD